MIKNYCKDCENCIKLFLNNEIIFKCCHPANRTTDLNGVSHSTLIEKIPECKYKVIGKFSIS